MGQLAPATSLQRLRRALAGGLIKQTPRQVALDYALITLGCLMMAVTNDAFWVPNRIVSGGVSGVGIITNFLFHWPVGLVMLALNLPLFLAGLRWGGGITTGIRTIYATIILSVSIDVLAPYIPSPTASPLLYITYGSIIDGIAMGLIFRAQATTGGTDIVGRLLRHFFGLEISRGVFIANALTTLAAIVVLGLEKAMYGVMVAALNAWVIDVVLAGGRRARQVIIISVAWEAVRDAILTTMERGVTILEGQGAFSGEQRAVLMVVIAPSEVAVLRRLVLATDPQAFVIIAATTEVWGEGFGSIHSEL